MTAQLARYAEVIVIIVNYDRRALTNLQLN